MGRMGGGMRGGMGQMGGMGGGMGGMPGFGRKRRDTGCELYFYIIFNIKSMLNLGRRIHWGWAYLKMSNLVHFCP